MTDGITIKLDDRQLQQAVDRISARLDDMRSAWRGVGRYLRSQVQLGFRSQTSPYGDPWEPTHRGGSILRDTGRMRDSVDFEAGDDFVAIGTNVKYAPTHQFGATIRAKNAPYLTFRIGDRWVQKKEVQIPARPFLPTEGLPDGWRAGVLNVLERHFQRAR